MELRKIIEFLISLFKKSNIETDQDIRSNTMREEVLTSFDEIIEVTLEHEGGYVHDPKDLGGETNFGIAGRFYPDVDIKNLRVTCSRSTNRERQIPFGPRVVEALGSYLTNARDKLLDGRSASALFLNHRGRRLTRQGFWLIIKGHARDAGIISSITPHTLRHSFATHQLRNEGTIPEVQSVLGHASPSTTQIYLELAREKGGIGGSLPGSQSRSAD